MGIKTLYYNPKLKELAKKLRKQGVLSEVLLWQAIKGRQLYGVDFHRQKPIDNFIVDFFCPELSLAIEIDGITQDYKIGDDILRQKKLESLGIRFLRFSDWEIRHNLQGVVMAIEGYIEMNKAISNPNTPRPLGTPL